MPGEAEFTHSWLPQHSAEGRMIVPAARARATNARGHGRVMVRVHRRRAMEGADIPVICEQPAVLRRSEVRMAGALRADSAMRF